MVQCNGTMNGIYSVVCQAVELLCDVHLGLRASNVGAGADERTCSTFCLIAWSDPWCSCGCRLTQFRSLLHVMDVSVVFVCDQWWLTEVIANSVCDCKRLQLDWMILCTWLVDGWYNKLMSVLFSVAVLLMGCKVCSHGMVLIF